MVLVIWGLGVIQLLSHNDEGENNVFSSFIEQFSGTMHFISTKILCVSKDKDREIRRKKRRGQRKTENETENDEHSI